MVFVKPIKARVIEHREGRAAKQKMIPCLDLGDIYLNDFLAADEEPPDKYPLKLMYEPVSGLVQLSHTVNPELMFRRYWYNSGTNESMSSHLGQIVSKILGQVALDTGDVVVDIGCNDGTMLKQYPDGLVKTVGFDPARDMRPGCDLFVNDFFSATAYLLSFPRQPAKVVTSIAMFYDIEDPVKFAGEVNQILDKDGLWVLEMHYLHTMLDKNEVDAICHEHLTYYDVSSLEFVLERGGFHIVDIEFNNVNGGSMLVFAKKKGVGERTARAKKIFDEEWEISTPESLAKFSEHVRDNKDELRVMLENIQDAGKKVIGYGASTKGNTLLQFCEISTDLLPYIADRNPSKFGRRTVGSNIPIISEEEARAMQPDYFLALPYHFMDSFLKRETDFLARGGQFIVPVPRPHLVGA